jgi:hypothetical protein
VAVREPKAVISVPTEELLLSLYWALRELPGEMGMSGPDPHELELIEFPKTPADVEELLGMVQEWLQGVELESVEVEIEGRSYPLRRSSA